MPNGEDLSAAVVGGVKAALARLPGMDVLIAGYDAAQHNRFQRETRALIKKLSDGLARLDAQFDPAWLSTDEGKVFVQKIIGCAINAELADKKELFANALINGSLSKRDTHLEKLKFIDMLRHISKAALMILAEIDPQFRPQVHGSGRTPAPGTPYPLIDRVRIAESLSDRYDPYLVEASVRELEGQGLFSNIGEWSRSPDGLSTPRGGFATELAYTDFTCRFVDFISRPRDFMSSS